MLVARQRILAGLVAFTGYAQSKKLGNPSFAMATTSAQPSEQVNFDRYLTYDYKPVGNTLKLKDETQFYGVGTPRSKHGVILIPDAWGWNAGRVRNIADFLATKNMYCVVPQLMGSSTDSPAGPSYSESASLGEYMKSMTFDSHLKPKITSLAKHMFSEGVEKIALIGFSWGGWVAMNVLASDIAENFVCGVLPHPSLNLEERVYGGNLAELFSRIERPLLLCPARGDPEEYESLAKLLKFKCPSTDFFDFHAVEHGFLLRGNIDDQNIKLANERALGQTLGFLQEHFKMNTNDLVVVAGKRGFSDTGEFAGRRGGGPSSSSWGSWFGSGAPSARQSSDQAGQYARDTYNRAGQSAQDAGQYVRESAREGYNQAQQAGQYASDSAREGYQRTKEGLGQAGQYVSESAQQGYDRARDNANQAGQYVSESARYGYDQAKQTGEVAAQRGQEAGVSLGDYTKMAGERIYEGAQRLGESIKQTFGGGSGDNEGSEGSQGQRSSQSSQPPLEQQVESRQQRSEGDARDYVRETGQWMGDKTREAGQAVQDTAKQGYEKAKETGQWASDQASQTGDYMREQAGKAGQYVQDSTNKASEKAQEGSQQTRDQANKAGQAVQDTARQGAQKAQETGRSAQDQTKQASERVQQSGQRTKEQGKEAINDAKRSVEDATKKSTK